MSIALHNLSGESCRFQPQFLANSTFHSWVDMRMGANCPADFADADALTCLRQPLLRAAEFVEHQRKLQAKCDWLRVHAVAAPNHRCHFEPARLRGDHRTQLL